MNLSEKYKKTFVYKLSIFSETEFNRLQEFAEIKHEVFGEKKLIVFTFKILPYMTPNTDLIVKLFNFRSSVTQIKIDLEFIYTEETLYSCLRDFIKLQSFDEEFKNSFQISNFQFKFPFITLISEGEKQSLLFENTAGDIDKFCRFLFGKWDVKLKHEKMFFYNSRHKKEKLLLFMVWENNFGEKKRYSLGLTNTKDFYYLSVTDEKYTKNIETLKELKKDEWYDCSFTLLNQQDTKSKSFDGYINSIVKCETPENMLLFDLSPKKISPIAIHTKFSAFDGLYKFEDFAKLAKKYNHSRIGIADFASAQSFSEVEKVSKKYNLKPAYGVELEIIPEKNYIVINLKEYKGQEQYAFFDIETTGLNPIFDDLIEVAVSKYLKGVLIEKYQSLIRIDKPIKEKIKELTGITDELLNEEGKELKEVLLEFKEFIKDCILVAHNGIEFDLPFLNSKLESCNLEKIKNPLIDTLALSRCIFWEKNFKSHSLSAVCKREGIEYNEFEAHRASHDIRVLSELFFKLIENLKNFEIDITTSLLELNERVNNYKSLNSIFGHHAILYSKNQEGIKDLYEVISISHTDCYYGRSTIKKSILERFRKNLIFVSSPLNSDLLQLLFKNDQESFLEAVKFYDFVIIPPLSHFKHSINRNEFTEEELKKALKKFYQWVTLSGKIPIFNYYAKYLYSWNEEQYSVLVHTKAISGKRHFLYSSKEKNNIMPDFYYKLTNELLDEYKFLLEYEELKEVAFKNIDKFWDLISENIEVIKKTLHSPLIPGCEQALILECRRKIKELFGNAKSKFIEERFQKELNSIIQNKFVVIYWVSHLLVKKSMEDGYLVGSRGSVGSSFVAYLMGISEVNPLPPYYACASCSYFELKQDFDESGFDLPKKKCPYCKKYLKSDGQNIPFETFLGFDGNKIPDIDLNFSGEYQNKAHNFLREKFGKKNVYRAGTISTIAEKTAYAVTKTYLEETRLPHNQGKLKWLSNQIIDIKRTSGQHPGGILVIPQGESVYSFTPVNYPANDTESEWLTTHFEFNDLHDALLKFDILGHDDPTIIRMLQNLTGANPLEIQYDDEKIIKLFSSCEVLGIKPEDIMGETVGTIALPEFGTTSTRKILQACKPKTFADLVRISGISHGTNVWKSNIDNLVKKEKYSLKNVISCRDDIMLYLISCGMNRKDAFNITESIRKGWGVSNEFLATLRKYAIPEWYIKSAQKISYIFPKAHAVAYVLMGWKIAYYKLYYPLHFYSAYFSLNSENFDANLIMKNNREEIAKVYQEIRRKLNSTNYEVKKSVKNKEKLALTIYEVAIEFLSRGFKFKSIDINKSQAFNFKISSENSLIIPFIVVEGLGEIKARFIEENREKNGEYQSLEDFERRAKLNKTALNKFINMNITPREPIKKREGF